SSGWRPKPFTRSSSRVPDGPLRGHLLLMSRNANYNIRERMANRFEVDQRAALFGSRFQGGAGSKKDDVYAAHSREVMERQNDAQIEDLEGKVSQLKEITRGIGKEVGDSNSLLDTMGIDFEKAAGMLKGTLNQLKVMMNNKSGKHMFYMVGFVLVLFFLMYFLRKMSSSSSSSFSSRAFVLGGRGVGKAALLQLCRDACRGPQPDLTPGLEGSGTIVLADPLQRGAAVQLTLVKVPASCTQQEFQLCLGDAASSDCALLLVDVYSASSFEAAAERGRWAAAAGLRCVC
ncbi:unnamed protein product, partial [Polarella glacialis]